MKYLSSGPFSSKPASKEYADNWDRIFGVKPENGHGVGDDFGGSDFDVVVAETRDPEKFVDRAYRRIVDLALTSYAQTKADLAAPIQNQVAAFHRAFGQPIVETPTVPPEDRVRLRAKLIAEEFLEYFEATFDWKGDRRYDDMRTALMGFIGDGYPYQRLPVKVDMVETADALADLAYVIEGANLEYGLASDEILAEVQRSNLSKLGEDGEPVYRADGKITKGPNFSPPDIEGVLERQGWKR